MVSMMLPRMRLIPARNRVRVTMPVADWVSDGRLVAGEARQPGGRDDREGNHPVPEGMRDPVVPVHADLPADRRERQAPASVRHGGPACM